MDSDQKQCEAVLDGLSGFERVVVDVYRNSPLVTWVLLSCGHDVIIYGPAGEFAECYYCESLTTGW